MGAAETGSGKTGAFGIPVLQLVHEALRQESDENGAAKGKASECAIALTYRYASGASM